MSRTLAQEPRVLASWKVRTQGAGVYITTSYQEFDSVAEALEFAAGLIRMGVAVHLEPLE